MCVTCGCGDPSAVHIEGERGTHEHVLPDGTRVVHAHHEHEHEFGHAHGHSHSHFHAAPGDETRPDMVALEQALLARNQGLAERNRGWFAGRGVVALNLMSSPGAGKTSLLVRTLQDLGGEIAMTVVEGDQETSADAERIRATGVRAVQINTNAGCHLEADTVQRAALQLAPEPGSLLFIENVGNLVCPALFDLGEKARVVLLSVAEGDDKPLKYPHMFRSAQLMITTKTDLAPHVPFDMARAERHARSVNPGLRCLRLSSTTGEGLADWYGWLRAMRKLEAWA